MTSDITFFENTLVVGFENVTKLEGATFMPSVSEDGELSWTNDRGLPNPAPVNIKGEKGDPGEKGEQGEPGTDGYTPVKGTDYWTEADRAEILAETEEDWQLLADVTTTEEIINFAIDKDMDGNPFSCRKIVAEMILPQVMPGHLGLYFGNALELWGGRPYAGINAKYDVSTFFDMQIELVKNKFAVLKFNQRATETFSSHLPHDTWIQHKDISNIDCLTKFFVCNSDTQYPLPVGTRILVWGCKA